MKCKYYKVLLFILVFLLSCSNVFTEGKMATDLLKIRKPKVKKEKVISQRKSFLEIVTQGNPRYKTDATSPQSIEVIIKFDSSVSQEEIQALHKKFGAKFKKRLDAIGADVLILPDGKTISDAVKFYKSNTIIKYVEPNYELKIHSIPNDQFFDNCWGLHNTGQTGGTIDADIDVPEAWNIATGNGSIVVAIIDTGADYSHEDLKDNMWVNPSEIPNNGIDDDGDGYIDDIRGINTINNSGDPMDDNGHGTHVAGIIGATGNNSKGISGVIQNVRLMSLKFLDKDGYGSVADAIECINYVLIKKASGINIKVVNNSWGGNDYSQALSDAIIQLKNVGIVFVASAGNDGVNIDETPTYPACYKADNIIRVVATDKNDKLASWSNYGAILGTVAAPGVDIYSTFPGVNPGDIVYDNAEGGTGSWDKIGWNITSSKFYEGANSWTDSPSGNYNNNTNPWMESQPIDISSYAGQSLVLAFYAWVDTEEWYDQFKVQVSGDGTWYQTLDSLSGNIRQWKFYSYLIPQSAITANFEINFSFRADDYYTYDGVYLDNIGIGVIDGSTNYTKLSGTSMAAPFVSGLAALIANYQPTATYSEIMDMITTSADPIAGLETKILSKGRINAYQALLKNPTSLPPVITNISPKKGPTGIDMTLEGRRFGATTGTVKFYNNISATVKSWNDNKIVCTVPANALSGDITITTSTSETAKVYFKVGNLWEMQALIPTPVSRAAIAVIDKKIYVIGGYLDGANNETDLVQIYDAEHNTWLTNGEPKLTACANASAAVVNGKIFVFGGYQSSIDTLLNVVEIYDPATDRWSTGANPLPQALCGTTATAYDGKIYVIGGDGTSGASATNYRYDPIANTWATMTALTDKRAYYAAAELNGKIYVFGGWKSGSVFLKTCERYNPATNTWQSVGSLNTGRYDLTGTSANGKIYAYGGNQTSFWNAPYLNDTEVFDTTTGQWAPTDKSLNKARQGLSGAAVGNYIYAIGGLTNDVSVDTNERLYIGPGLPPTANPVIVTAIGVDKASGVVPLTSNFNVTAVGGSGTYIYSWDFGDGSALSASQNPSHLYATVGNYSAVVTVTDANDSNNKTTGQLQIIVVAVPEEYSPVGINVLSCSPSNGYASINVAFTVTPTGGSGVYNYSWNFGDDSALNTNQNPSHQYDSIGNFTVIVTVKDANDLNNVTTGQLLIKTVAEPTSYLPINITGIGVDKASGVAPLSSNFNITTSGGSGVYNYSWNFGDGTGLNTNQNPNHQYDSVGNFSAIVTVKDANDLNNVTTGGQLLIKTVAEPTAYSPINITSIGVDKATGVAPLSSNFNVTTSGGSGVYSYSWDFGDGSGLNTNQNPNHQYDSVGNFTAIVMVKDANDLNNVTTGQLLIKTVAEPTAYSPINITSIGVDKATGVAPLSSNFNVTAIGGSGVYIYSWDFGDDTSLNMNQNPSHVYSNVGTYDVIVTVTDANDLSNKTINQLRIVVVSIPIAYSPVGISILSCNLSNGYAPLNVAFAVTPIDGSGVYNYSWNFGDGSGLSTNQNPNHQYDSVGNFLAIVTVKDANDSNNVTTGQLLIKTVAEPTSYLPINITGIGVDKATGVVPLISNFNVIASGGSGVYNYSWNFGDDSVLDTNQNPSHQYDSVGNFTVIVTVKDANDLNNVTTGQLLIKTVAEPTSYLPINITGIGVDKATGVAPLSSNFNITTSGGSGVYNYSWNFGDGTGLNTNQNPNHQYDSVGNFLAIVTVKDANDLNNVTTGQLLIKTVAEPTAYSPINITSIGVDKATGVVPLISNFNVIASGGSGVYNYSWNFGDDSVLDTNQNPSHQYDSVGNFIAIVTVKDANDLSNVTTGQLLIKTVVEPTAYSPINITSIGVDKATGVVPLISNFNVTVSGGSGVYSYLWNFGDGTGLSTSQNPSHVYSNVGTYDVIVTVTDANDLSNKTINQLRIVVVSLPIAYSPVELKLFSANPTVGMVPLAVKFEIEVTGGSSNNYAYLWNFGNGKTSEIKNPEHLYETAGVYSVQGSVWDLNDITNLRQSVLSIVVLKKPLITYDTVTVYNTTIIANIKHDTTSTPAVENNKKACIITTMGVNNKHLSKVRDEILLKNKVGKWIIETYYFISPKILEIIK